jgi:integrase
VPLNADAVAAFRAFRRADAFGPFSTASLRNSLRRACKSVLDENDKPIQPIHPHVLRHSFASWLVNEGGVSLKTAQRMLGHRSIKTTSRYVRDDEEKARLALKRLESVG